MTRPHRRKAPTAPLDRHAAGIADDTSRRRWLTPNVRALALVSFLQDASSEMLYPILPIFLTTALGAPAAVVGVVEGVAEGAAALMKLISGRLADRRPKRPLVALGYGAAAVGKVIIAAAFVWPVVLVGRVVDRVGKGIRSAPRDALLVADVPASERGRVFGFHRAADTAGAVVGPLIGLGLFELLSGQFRPLLIVAVVPAVLSVALVAAVHERPNVAHKRTDDDGTTGRDRVLPVELRRLVLILGVFGIVNFPDALLLLRAHDLGLSTAGVIAAYALYNAVYAAISYPAGATADRIGHKRAFIIGLGFFAVGYLGLALINAPALVFVVLPVYGGFAAFTDGVGKAWVSTLAPAHAQGHAQGIYQGVSGAAILLAGVWAGLLWHHNGRLPLAISGIAAIAIAALIARRPDAQPDR